MTQHTLQGRTEKEILWFQRRGFLQAAAAWTAAGGWQTAQAQARSNIVELRGDALVNGRAITAQQTIQTGDQIETGPGSNLIFVLGNASFQVRQSSRLTVERGASLFSVSVLRLVAGGVASVWGRGSRRQIVMPTMTAGIRGTGVYSEVMASQNGRGYFCNCYGTVDMGAGNDKVVSQSSYHQAFWGEVEPRNGRLLNPAGAINHTDEELEVLARLVNQRTAWQISGVRGTKDGKGLMYDQPGQAHPAEMLGK